MRVINHNSVNLLFEKAEDLGQKPHESWRCIYFKFSDKPEKNNHMLYNNFVVRPIIDLTADTPGYIYLCGDADIFLLFQGALKPVLAKLGTHFGDINPEQITDQIDGDMVSIFDLGRHWNEFQRLCEMKYYEGMAFAEDGVHKRPIHTPSALSLTAKSA